jgi:cytochrome c oxidase assembly protein subunit 11
MFCSSTGFIGTPITDASRFTSDKLIPDSSSSRVKITFTANTSQALQWTFIPEQREIHVLPGETALAFYKAKNTSNEDIIGIATYNVTPDKAGQYFNKIQCFCFEEQKLKAGEEVDMPVFFFLDPEIAKDPFTRNIRTVTLSYTFFKVRC